MFLSDKRCQFVVLFQLCLLFGDTNALLMTEWESVQGMHVSQVSVGPAGAWGTCSTGYINYRAGTYGNTTTQGTGWERVTGRLVQLDVGPNIVWGVNSQHTIFLRIGIQPTNPKGTGWVIIPGSLKHVTVSENGHVWGVNDADDVYYRVGASIPKPTGRAWLLIPGQLKQISAGLAGVWGVNAANQIFYRQGTIGDPICSGVDWIQVPGTLSYISSGIAVWGTDPCMKIYRRLGVNSTNPIGTTWMQVQGGLGKLDTWSNSVWGTNNQGDVFKTLPTFNISGIN